MELIRERPGFAADLLRQVLHVEVPAFSEARLADGALNERDARTEGKAEGLATALIQVVEGRGLQLSVALRQRITTAPVEQLSEMLRRAAVVATADDLFDT